MRPTIRQTYFTPDMNRPYKVVLVQILTFLEILLGEIAENPQKYCKKENTGKENENCHICNKQDRPHSVANFGKNIIHTRKPPSKDRRTSLQNYCHLLKYQPRLDDAKISYGKYLQKCNTSLRLGITKSQFMLI